MSASFSFNESPEPSSGSQWVWPHRSVSSSWDRLVRHSTPKLLEGATAALFSLILGYQHFTSGDVSVIQVRLTLHLGLWLIAAVSVAIGKPFTLQYVRESTPASCWHTAEFFRKNATISPVWGAVVLALVGADLLFLYAPEVPRGVAVTITIPSPVAASKYTTRATVGESPQTFQR